MKRRKNNISDWILFVFIGFFATVVGVGGLKDVVVTVPAAVTPGDTVTLQCQYDLENDPLYTVKWYKGRQEFFRYIPKELPHTKVFSLPGINVDVSKSGANEVVLRDVQLEMAGKYRCEVSADAPSFHTSMVASYMHVVYLPEDKPTILMEKQRYAVGDVLRANCTSSPSNPSTNLTWYINSKKANASFQQRYAVDEDEHSVKGDRSNETHRHVSVAGLEMDIDITTFRGGKIRIECHATIFELYQAMAEVVLEEERPRLAPVLGTRESSSAGSTFQRRGQFLWILSVVCVIYDKR